MTKQGRYWFGTIGGMARLVPLALVLVAGWGCAETYNRVSGTFGPMPFHSEVTVTGNDVPGPLRIREFNLAFADGAQQAKVPTGGSLAAVFTAWVNGHGQFLGRWERNGEVVDRVDFFLTYGESLEIRLEKPEALGLDRPGEYQLRFVVEAPEPQADGEQADPLMLSYSVGY